MTDVVRHSDWSTLSYSKSRSRGGGRVTDTTDKYYKNALMTASIGGQLDMVKYLIEHGY